MCSLALYYLTYPGSIDGTGLNLPLESNDIQVQIPVQVRIFLLNLNCNSSRYKREVFIYLSIWFKNIFDVIIFIVRSPGIYSWGRQSDEAMNQSVWNGIPYHQMRSVGRTARQGEKGGENKRLVQWHGSLHHNILGVIIFISFRNHRS